MRGRGFKAVFILGMLTIALAALAPRPDRGRAILNPQSMYDSGAVALEHYVAGQFPAAEQLRRLWLELRMLGGQREYSGVFVGESGLMKKIDHPVEAMLAANIEAIGVFSDYYRELGKPVYLAILPTAGGVLQQNLPPFSSAVNQQRIIEEAYGQLAGRVTAIGAHGALAKERERYIYYRTEDNLTAYGGYLVYGEMASRLLGLDSADLGRYHVTYGTGSFYGDLYELAPYRGIEPDTLSTWHYATYPRQYLVTHTGASGRKVYHTLYPAGALALEDPMSLYLGGQSAVVDIRTNAPNSRRLLVFGDKTALSYLPFLAGHYRQITLIDLFHSENLYASIRPEDYTQILFAYGIESFTTTSHPSRALTLLRESE